MSKKPKAMTPEESSQTFTSRGLERQAGNAVLGFARRALGLSAVHAASPAPDMEGYLTGVRGSPNHRLYLRAWRWMWAITDNYSDLPESRQYLAEFLSANFTTEGQGWAEVLSTSHFNQMMTPLLAARAVARKYEDSVILDLTGKYMRRERYLYDLLSDREGRVFSPGARSAGAHNDLRTVVYALLRDEPAPSRIGDSGRPIPGNPNNENGPFWSNVANSSAWLCRELLRAGDTVAGDAHAAKRGYYVTEEPILRGPLKVEKRGDDFVYSFGTVGPVKKASKPFLWWCAFVDGRYIDGPLTGAALNDWCPDPKPPALPGASCVIVPGVEGTPCDCEEEDEET